MAMVYFEPLKNDDSTADLEFVYMTPYYGLAVIIKKICVLEKQKCFSAQCHI